MSVNCRNSHDGLFLLEPQDRRWAAFVASKPQANIFHHPAWSNLLAESYGYEPFVVTVSDDSGFITAGLPIMEIRSRLTGRRWVSLPFSDHCVPLYDDADSLRRLAEGLTQLSKEPGNPAIEVRAQLPDHSYIFTHFPYVLHTAALEPDAESVAQRIHRMHRRNIRVAEKKGVRIEWGVEQEQFDTFYGLHLHTRRRQGAPVQPRRFFDLLRDTIVENELGFVMLAYKDADCLAAAVFLHWHQTLAYKYGASDTSGTPLRPNNLLFWSAIRWGCENGYKVLDLGRTNLENRGLRDFKSKWGAVETPLEYSVLPAASLRSQDSRLLHVMESVIQRSPVWVCRVTGELLYKHFG